MKEIVLAKYGEIALKGLNKSRFESLLVKNLKRRLGDLGQFRYTRAQSIIYIEPLDDGIDMNDVVARVSKTFGIASICRSA